MRVYVSWSDLSRGRVHWSNGDPSPKPKTPHERDYVLSCKYRETVEAVCRVVWGERFFALEEIRPERKVQECGDYLALLLLDGQAFGVSIEVKVRRRVYEDLFLEVQDGRAEGCGIRTKASVFVYIMLGQTGEVEKVVVASVRAVREAYEKHKEALPVVEVRTVNRRGEPKVTTGVLIPLDLIEPKIVLDSDLRL